MLKAYVHAIALSAALYALLWLAFAI